MGKKAARNFFILGTAICTIVFIWLTIDTHTTIPKRTNTDKLTEEVVLGKRVWHHRNCNDCHTILGPTASMIPDAFFKRNVTIMAGVRILNPDLMIKILKQGGSAYHLLKECSGKIAFVR